MTVEELLKPRYKVIADYPYNGRKVGDIFNPSETIEAHANFLNKYPHIFKKLEWWEDREEKDMPEYVKSINNEKFIEKVERYYLSRLGVLLRTHVIDMDIRHFIPATEEEYLNQPK